MIYSSRFYRKNKDQSLLSNDIVLSVITMQIIKYDLRNMISLAESFER